MYILNNIELNVRHTIVLLNKGQTLFSEGAYIDEVGIVLEGELIISSTTMDGFSFEIHRIENGDIFGNNLVLLNKHHLPGNISALKKSKVILIKTSDFKQLLNTNSTFLTNYLLLSSEKAVTSQYRIKLLSQPSIREKILFFIKEEITKTNTNKVYLNMTKEKLSLLLSTSRPSLSRELMRMKNDGLIDYDHHSITYLK